MSWDVERGERVGKSKGRQKNTGADRHGGLGRDVDVEDAEDQAHKGEAFSIREDAGRKEMAGG